MLVCDGACCLLKQDHDIPTSLWQAVYKGHLETRLQLTHMPMSMDWRHTETNEIKEVVVLTPNAAGPKDPGVSLATDGSGPGAVLRSLVEHMWECPKCKEAYYMNYLS